MVDICLAFLIWFKVERLIGRTSRTWSSHGSCSTERERGCCLKGNPQVPCITFEHGHLEIFFPNFRQTRIEARCSLGMLTPQDEPIFFEPHIGSEARFLGYHVRNAPEEIGVMWLFWWTAWTFASKSGHAQFAPCFAAKPGLVRRPDGTSRNCVRPLLGPSCHDLS